MFRQEIKFIFRKLLHNKSYTLINPHGTDHSSYKPLLLIFKHISREWESDRFHPGTKKIYRVNPNDQNSPDGPAGPYGIIGPYAKKEIPGIENYVRCFFPQSLGIQPEGDTEIFLESACMYADLSLFDLFHFPILTGDAHIPDVSNWRYSPPEKQNNFSGHKTRSEESRAKYTYREDSSKEFQIIAVMDNLPPYLLHSSRYHPIPRTQERYI